MTSQIRAGCGVAFFGKGVELLFPRVFVVSFSIFPFSALASTRSAWNRATSRAMRFAISGDAISRCMSGRTLCKNSSTRPFPKTPKQTAPTPNAFNSKTAAVSVFRSRKESVPFPKTRSTTCFGFGFFSFPSPDPDPSWFWVTNGTTTRSSLVMPPGMFVSSTSTTLDHEGSRA